jgi:hypothetical protein
LDPMNPNDDLQVKVRDIIYTGTWPEQGFLVLDLIINNFSCFSLYLCMKKYWAMS